MSRPPIWLLTKAVHALDLDIRNMQQLHSSEEDLSTMPQEDLAEAYGTPPTRNNSIKPLRKLSGKECNTLPHNASYMLRHTITRRYLLFPTGRKTKKLEKEGTQAQKNKQVSFSLRPSVC